MSEEVSGITIRQDHVSVRAKLRTREDVAWAIRTLSVMQEALFPQAQRFDVVLAHCGERKINVIKEIRSLTGVGLKEAKDLSEATNAIILSGIDIQQASAASRVLADQGADVSVRACAA